jgi:hypothetical protein
MRQWEFQVLAEELLDVWAAYFGGFFDFDDSEDLVFN